MAIFKDMPPSSSLDSRSALALLCLASTIPLACETTSQPSTSDGTGASSSKTQDDIDDSKKSDGSSDASTGRSAESQDDPAEDDDGEGGSTGWTSTLSTSKQER